MGFKVDSPFNALITGDEAVSGDRRTGRTMGSTRPTPGTQRALAVLDYPCAREELHTLASSHQRYSQKLTGARRPQGAEWLEKIKR